MDRPSWAGLSHGEKRRRGGTPPFVGTTMPIERLSNIGTDTGSGTDELIGENPFPFGTLDLIAYSDDFQSEGFRLG